MNERCSFCGAEVSSGASACSHCGAPRAATRDVRPPPAQGLLQPDGQLSAYGREVCDRVFDRFDTHRDDALMLSELNAISAFCGDAPLNADAWSVVLEAQGVRLNAQGYVPRDQYATVFRFGLLHDPARTRGDLERLGITVAPEAFPPQPSPAQQQELQRMLSARVQQVVAQRAQMSQYFHNLNLSVIAAYPTGGPSGPGRCAYCGAAKSGSNCPSCGRW